MTIFTLKGLLNELDLADDISTDTASFYSSIVHELERLETHRKPFQLINTLK